MTQNVEQQPVDVDAIHPRNGSKYSPNLHAWLTLRERPCRARTSRVFTDKNGVHYIGYLDDGYLIGSNLIGVLCNGRKEQAWAFGFLGELTEIPDFWERYTAIGRCAIDPEHTMHFTDDKNRWKEGTIERECLWCGNHHQRLQHWVESVRKSAWEPIKRYSPASAEH